MSAQQAPLASDACGGVGLSWRGFAGACKVQAQVAMARPAQVKSEDVVGIISG